MVTRTLATMDRGLCPLWLSPVCTDGISLEYTGLCDKPDRVRTLSPSEDRGDPMGELAPTTQLTSDIGHAEPTAWYPPASMTQDQWQQIGNTLQQVSDSINWWLGDWLNAGEKRYGVTYLQAVRYTNRKVDLLRKCAWVAKAVAPERRRETLSYTHHVYVADLADHEQERYLALAEAEGWDTDRLWQELHPEKRNNRQVLRPTVTPEQALTWLTQHFDPQWLAALRQLLAQE